MQGVKGVSAVSTYAVVSAVVAQNGDELVFDLLHSNELEILQWNVDT